jgi:hypothetical protein
MKAVIAIDNWKEEIFMSILKRHGWDPTVGPGLTDDTKHIAVQYNSDNFDDLHKCVRECEATAKSTKK